MKKRTILNAMMAICIAVGLSGCAGKDGAEGAPGAQGPAGTNGVSNMISYNYTVLTTDWTSLGGNQWSVTSGSQTLPTTDLVTGFYSVDNASFFPLPQTSIWVVGDDLTFGYKTGSAVTFFYTGSSSAPPQTVYLNVFDVPPGIMKQHPGTNWKNYSEVHSIMGVQNTSTKVK